jgi:hypothetical protein
MAYQNEMLVEKIFYILRACIVCYIVHILMLQSIEILHDFMHAITHVMMKLSFVFMTGFVTTVIVDIITK